MLEPQLRGRAQPLLCPKLARSRGRAHLVCARLARSQGRAQGLIEYGLIVALVAVLAIAALVIFGPALSSFLTRLGVSV